MKEKRGHGDVHEYGDGRWIGHRLHAEVEITVDDDSSPAQGRAIAHEVEGERVRPVPRLSRAVVHARPARVADRHGR